MFTGDLCRVPPAVVRHVRARQSSGTGPCGDCRKLLWVPGPRGQYSGKFVLSRNPGHKTRRDALWLNVVLTPGSYPEVKVLERVVVIVDPLPHGGLYSGNFVVPSPGGKWAQETCAGCPQQL